ncbi:MAG: YggS family pyridoxal phosphate-dependent enzyme [Deltaproteobacteria bacterium]
MSLAEIKTRILAAEAAAGRPVGSVKLIAVSKVQPLDRVVSVLDQGQRLFGENRVQEAQGKWPDLSARYANTEVHLIGPLQTNKARAAVDLFSAIHTLDRLKLAETLARLRDEDLPCPDLFIQVNTGAEPQKAGVLPTEADTLIRQTGDLDLPLVGLMCIPPDGSDPAPHFKMLAEIAARNDLSQLSMGMSGDFETAITCGATHVRVGSAIFGTR